MKPDIFLKVEADEGEGTFFEPQAFAPQEPRTAYLTPLTTSAELGFHPLATSFQMVEAFAIPTLANIPNSDTILEPLGGFLSCLWSEGLGGELSTSNSQRLRSGSYSARRKRQAFSALADAVGGAPRLELPDEALRATLEEVERSPREAPRFLRALVKSYAGAVVLDAIGGEAYTITKEEAALVGLILQKATATLKDEALLAVEKWCQRQGVEAHPKNEDDLAHPHHQKPLSRRFPFIPPTLQKEGVEEVLGKALDAGGILQLREDGEGFKWNGSALLLAFFVGRLWLGDAVKRNKRGEAISWEAERSKRSERLVRNVDNEAVRALFGTTANIGKARSKQLSEEKGEALPDGWEAVEAWL